MKVIEIVTIFSFSLPKKNNGHISFVFSYVNELNVQIKDGT